MILLTSSITFFDYRTLSLTGVTDATPLNDGDRFSFVETASLTPVYEIDFGAGKSYVADTIWIKGQHLQNYTMSASHDGSTFTTLISNQTVPSSGISYKKFTNVTAYRYWRVTFSTRNNADPLYRIYGIYFMNQELDLQDEVDRPIGYRAPRQRGIFYRALNGDLVWFEPEGTFFGKATVTLRWGSLANAKVKALKAIWEGRSSYATKFGVYPRPESEPQNLFMCRWVGDFEFRYSGTRIEHGQEGTLTFQEI